MCHVEMQYTVVTAVIRTKYSTTARSEVLTAMLLKIKIFWMLHNVN